MGTLKKKIILLMFSLALCFIIVGCFFVRNHKLEKPVYYQHLIEHFLPTIADSTVSTSIIHIMYITDAWDDRKVEQVEMLDALTVTVLGDDTERLWPYQVKKVSLYLEWNYETTEEVPKAVEINEMKVSYSDSSDELVKVGKIFIYSGADDKKFIEATGCVPLYDSLRVQNYITKQDILFKGFSPISMECLKEADILESFSLLSEGRDLSQPDTNIEIKKGSKIDFSMVLKGTREGRLRDLASNYDYYELRPKLMFSDSKGKNYLTSIFSPAIYLELDSYSDVKEYLKRRLK